MKNQKQQELDPALVQEELKRISALRMQMLEMHPFWGYLLLQMRLIPAPGLPAFAATDCIRNIWFNPQMTSLLSDPMMVGFILAHEVGHQLFISDRRRAGRDRNKWNMATDYAINRIVADIKNAFGGQLYAPLSGDIPGLGKLQILLDSKYDGMIAEAIYEHLTRDQKGGPRIIQVVLSLTGGSGQGDDTGGSITIPDLQDHQGGIDVHLPDSLDEDQREEIRERIAAAVENWKANSERGSFPGNVLRSLGFLDRPKVPWQRLLHRFADQALARDDYSLARPNKRYLESGFVVPGPYGERVGSIVVALDTSGSISPDMLNAVARELRGIAASVEEMTLIVADAKVQAVVDFDKFEEFIKAGKVPGGGGTDHRPVFSHIEQKHLNPRLFIGLTDLYSQFPQSPPPYPVLWLVSGTHGKAPWGKVIEI